MNSAVSGTVINCLCINPTGCRVQSKILLDKAKIYNLFSNCVPPTNACVQAFADSLISLSIVVCCKSCQVYCWLRKGFRFWVKCVLILPINSTDCRLSVIEGPTACRTCDTIEDCTSDDNDDPRICDNSMLISQLKSKLTYLLNCVEVCPWCCSCISTGTLCPGR